MKTLIFTSPCFKYYILKYFCFFIVKTKINQILNYTVVLDNYNTSEALRRFESAGIPNKAIIIIDKNEMTSFRATWSTILPFDESFFFMLDMSGTKYTTLLEMKK